MRCAAKWNRDSFGMVGQHEDAALDNPGIKTVVNGFDDERTFTPLTMLCPALCCGFTNSRVEYIH